MPGKIDRVIAA